MPERERFSRRRLMQALAGLGLMTGPHSRDAAAEAPSEGRWPRYQQAMVLDFLATPGPSNTPDDLARPLSADMLCNAVESGISAVNLSVDGDTVEETFRNIGYWERELNAHPDQLARIRSITDLEAAKRSGRLGLIYGFQGTGLLSGNPDLLDEFASFGVRIVQLTYNARELAGDGCLEAGNAGLSRYGHRLVERLNALHTLLDLSHAGQRTTKEAIEKSKSPVAISHAGCRALADRPRNVGDAEMRLMADRGGVIGIYLMPFLTVGGVPTADDVIRHIEHAVKICGEDHVGIGSDLSITPINLTEEYRRAHRLFVESRREHGTAAPGEDPDVFFFVPELNSPRRLELVSDRLSARGHSNDRIDKIVGGNFGRLLRDVW